MINVKEEKLKKHLREEGYEYLNAGHSKEGLVQHLFKCFFSYQNNQNQQQNPSNDDQSRSQTSDNTNQATPNASTQPITIEHKSRFDFWDIMLLSSLWGRGGNTTINNYATSTNRIGNESDGRVLGPCIAAFCLIFAAVASYFLLVWAAYKIKNAKLENNKYSVPSAIGLGVFSFSVSATLVLLLSGMIVPNLQRAMGISSGAFTGFQVITGLNAVIFGLGAVLFFYLAINKADKKALVDKKVDQIIKDQHKQHQNQSSPPSAPPPYEQSVQSHQYCDQPGFDGYNPEYSLHQNNQFQQSTYLYNPNLTSCSFDQSLPPKY